MEKEEEEMEELSSSLTSHDSVCLEDRRKEKGRERREKEREKLLTLVNCAPFPVTGPKRFKVDRPIGFAYFWSRPRSLS